MRDVQNELAGWLAQGRPFALATVVRTWSSAPRPAGAVMAVREPAEVVGSLSGGCVEGAAYELCQQVLADGVTRTAHYGVSGSDAAAVGLTCGGQIDIVVVRIVAAGGVTDQAGNPGDPRVRQALAAAVAAVGEDRGVALAQLVTPGDPALGAMVAVGADWSAGGLGGGNSGGGHSDGGPDDGATSSRIDAAVLDDARGRLAIGRSGTLTYGADGERLGDGREVFVAVHAPRPRLIVVGAIDFARAVARLGTFLGFDVTVVDARPVFATVSRFPEADRVIVDWPHRYLAGEIDAGRVDPTTVLAVLTHDPKFDIPLLEVALPSRIGYIGAMGSRKTHEERLDSLRERDVDPAAIARLRSPIGLDLGARTPEETALSVLAEVVAERWGGSCAPLTATAGRIHVD